MYYRAVCSAFVFYIISINILFGQAKLPDTPQGKIVQAYVDAFNSGDDGKILAFFRENVSKEGLANRPAEARLERTKMFRSNAKSLILLSVLNANETELSVTAKDVEGQVLTLTFGFDRKHKFDGMRVEMGNQPHESTPPMSAEGLLPSIEHYLTQRTSENKFSGAVLVARDTSIVFKKAYGEADKRFNIPNRIDTKFNIGSINKLFTRVAIGQLAEQGKLSLDKPLVTYLPEYPNPIVARKVSINQLLSMTSGMGDFFGEKFDNAPKDKIRSLQDYLQFFVDDSLLFEPGSQRRYSNAGFIVLGLLVEKVSGQDYYSYMRDHVFLPAGMTNTDWYPMSGATSNLATGYLPLGGSHEHWISNIHMLPERGSSAGGGYSTLDDMLSFVYAVLNGKLLSPKYSEWLVTGDLPSTDPPIPLMHGGLANAGGTAGVNAVIHFEAESKEVLVILSNYDPPSAEDAERTIWSWMQKAK